LAKDLALRSALRKAAAYEGAPLVRRAGLRYHSASWSDYSEDQQLRLAQEGSTILYAALRIIAVAAASPPWIAERRRGDDWEQLPADDPAARIVSEPNGFDDWRSLMERLVFCLIPTGNHLWYMQPGVSLRAGLPPIAALWPLLPGFAAKLGDDNYPISYKCLGRDREYKPEEVIHFQRVNARSLGWGSGMVAASARVIASDVATAEWQQESYENRLVPDGAFVTSAVLTPEQRAVVKEAIEGKSGPAAAHEALHLEGGWKWERSALTPIEADYLGTRDKILEEICAAVNLRPALLVPNAKYANLEQSRKSLWLDNVLPELAGVASKVTRVLGPHFGRPGEVRWRPNTEAVEALRELIGERMLSFQRAVRNGVPYNDAAALFALPLRPLPEGIGDIPFGASEAIMLDRIRAEEGLVATGGGGGGIGRSSLWPRARAAQIKAIKVARALPAATLAKAEARARAATLFAAARALERRLAAAYRRIAEVLRAPSDARRERIAAALLSGDTSAATLAAGTGTLRAGLGLPAVDQEDLGAGFEPLLVIVGAGARQGVTLGAAALSEQAGRQLSVPPEVADAWTFGWAPERAEQIVGSTERGLAETAAALPTLPGWGEAMAAAVAGLFGSIASAHGEQAGKIGRMLAGLVEARGIEEAIRRAERMAAKAAAERALLIAEHNATRAVFGGQQQAAADLLHRGILTAGRRRWVDSDDGRVCPECGSLDGEEAGLDEPYVSPLSGASYAVPGDPHNKCRCGEIYFEIEVSAAA
jgi:phage portal protein BeeE